MCIKSKPRRGGYDKKDLSTAETPAGGGGGVRRIRGVSAVGFTTNRQSLPVFIFLGLRRGTARGEGGGKKSGQGV